MNGFIAVYLREMLILKYRFKRQLAGMAVSPLLYLITFGYAMGDLIQFGDQSYLHFLIPGLVAMASMTQSFGIATDINVARFYWNIFEEFQAAPISNLSYVAGEVLAGMTRALIGVVVILLLSLPFGVVLHYGPLFWLAIVGNSFVFASLAVGMAMLVKSHADQSLLTSFIITPMAFLGGTFFPVEKLPIWAQGLLSCLPLTHASHAIRATASGKAADGIDYLVLTVVGLVFFWLALHSVNKARD
ncbi:ABC transporter permease [Desulfobulbus rhabdoformis]|uniref:ABC transporter permease n=1 Tax=Desulfobulbus rhabdoformis TaxID=34032 RepID=UPI001964B2DE|nr:ABC transporter permease [Desulfobulbus rhabdoformis]MBM9616139.1 ABC transporter permease [Desulfobulbus rhabdoformis]